MNRPTAVDPRENYRIWISYTDGSSGEVDLSDLAGRGVFALWDEPEHFEAVFITPDGGIAWGEDIELCPDAIYMQLTGKTVEEVMPEVPLAIEFLNSVGGFTRAVSQPPLTR